MNLFRFIKFRNWYKTKELGSESEKEFIDKMNKRYEENKHNPELLAHRIDYLWKEVERLSVNEKQIIKACDELENSVRMLNHALCTKVHKAQMNEFEFRLEVLESIVVP